jgi:PTH2 family peptidyl-tRNA hydrolase
MTVKQVIVVRNDLRSKLRHGKLAAQVAHASLGAVFSKSYVEQHTNGVRTKVTPMSPETEIWFNEKFTKIILRCDSEMQLLSIHQQAEDAGLLRSLIQDAGDTVFKEPTYTCVGIGPATNEQLAHITDKLKMY